MRKKIDAVAAEELLNGKRVLRAPMRLILNRCPGDRHRHGGPPVASHLERLSVDLRRHRWLLRARVLWRARNRSLGALRDVPGGRHSASVLAKCHCSSGAHALDSRSRAEDTQSKWQPRFVGVAHHWLIRPHKPTLVCWATHARHFLAPRGACALFARILSRSVSAMGNRSPRRIHCDCHGFPYGHSRAYSGTDARLGSTQAGCVPLGVSSAAISIACCERRSPPSSLS